MEIMAGIAFPLLISICCILAVSIYNHFYKRGNLPPGPIPLPILGNLLQLNTSNMGKSLKEMSEKYGPVFTVYMGPKRVVMLWGFDAVKEALIDRGDEFSDRGPIPVFDKLVKESGVSFANGDAWKQLHRFTILTLRNFGMGKKGIEERIQEEAQYLMGEFQMKKESPFDPTIYFSYATANVICSVLFGERFDYQDEEFQSLLKMINDIFMMSSTIYGQLIWVCGSSVAHTGRPASTLQRVDKHFMERFQLDKQVVSDLIVELEQAIALLNTHRLSIPPLLRLQAVLQFLALGTFQHTSATLHGMAWLKIPSVGFCILS